MKFYQLLFQISALKGKSLIRNLFHNSRNLRTHFGYFFKTHVVLFMRIDGLARVAPVNPRLCDFTEDDGHGSKDGVVGNIEMASDACACSCNDVLSYLC